MLCKNIGTGWVPFTVLMAVWLAAPDETWTLPEVQKYDSNPFTIKLGGDPAWLYEPNSVAIPKATCKECKASMVCYPKYP